MRTEYNLSFELPVEDLGGVNDYLLEKKIPFSIEVGKTYKFRIVHCQTKEGQATELGYLCARLKMEREKIKS